MLNKFFKLHENHTNIKTEILAGLTTFLSMFYIIFVNPQILQETGIPFEAAFGATVIASAIATLLVGLLANTPFALAPGMGINATFTYTACLGMGFTWQEALFSVFVSGTIFFILSISSIRQMIIRSIPDVLKNAVGVGIGFFIAFIGLKNSGIVIGNESTLVGLGDFTQPIVIITVISIFMAIIFVLKNNNIGLFFTMIFTVVACLIGQYVFKIDLGFVPMNGFDPNMLQKTTSAFMQAFNVDIFGLITNANFWIIVFSFLFVDFFDTTGLLVTLGKKANIIQKDGSIKNESKIMISDSLATIIGSLLGTSSVTTYMESLSGIAVGGKTGLTSVITAICFILSLFLYPIFEFLTPVMNAIATPSLVIVGIMMIGHIADVDFTKFKNSASVFMTIFFTIGAYSISEGISAGIITYVVCSLFDNEYKKVSPIMYVLAIFFILHYILL